jgi:hypothetical protein
VVMKLTFLTLPLAMHFCGFCGKGPFSASSRLNKHIRNSVKCNEAKRKEWDSYSRTIWKNIPGPSDAEQERLVSPPVLEDNEVANMPDITLESDILGHEDNLSHSREDEPENLPDVEIQPEPRGRVGVTVEDEDDLEREKDSESTFYVEEFPVDLGAGAIWGEDIPFFEKLWREQGENGSSRWGPFEDQDEWELAMWLIRNVGQKQINAFSNLNIVSPHHL